MKKLLYILPSAFCFLPLMADAAPSYLYRDGANGYVVSYDYRSKPKNNWYMALRAELTLMSWKNEYSSNDMAYVAVSEDKYSAEPVFGGSASFGKKFGTHWRGDIEVGYTGKFTDRDNGAEFNISAPYALANLMYDFTGGIYLGLGAGAALPTISIDDAFFAPGGRTKNAITPMGAVMLGFAKQLDDDFVLDVRYRLSGFGGATLKREIDPMYAANPGDWYETKVGLVLDNSFSIGIRYEF